MESRNRLSLAFVLVVVAIFGCGAENKLGRKPVAGKILLDGAPLPQGTILFAPDQPGGVSSGATIEAGEYSIDEQQGLTPGIYSVRIYSADEEAEKVAPEIPGPGIKAAPETIAPKYNMRSELKLTVVESDQQATFDLDMEPRGAKKR